jgi:hypothetical protein
MKTKLLFLSLALMTMGEVSEVKADTTIADLTATQVTAFDGAVKTLTEGYSVWIKESGPTATSGNNSWNWSTGGTYVLWSYRLTDNLVISQTINDAAAGTYLLKTYMNKNQGTASVTITSGETTLATYNYTSTAGTYYVPFYNNAVRNIKFTYTFSGGGSINWGNDYLYSIKEDDATANYTTILSEATSTQIEGLIAGMSEAKKALKDILESANTAYADYGSAVGSSIFQYQSSYYEALGTAKTSAQSVYDNATSTDEQYSAQTTALTTAYNNFFTNRNLPDAEKYYYIKNTASEGIYYLNLSDDYSNDGVGRNRLSTLPYAVQFETATDGKFYIKSPAGKYIYAATTWENGMSTENKAAWNVVTNGDGTISFYIMVGYLWTPWVLNTETSVGKTNKEAQQIAVNWTVTEASKESVTANITSALWSTFVAPFEVTLPEGVTAYTCTYDAQTGKLTTTPTGSQTITANTAVLLNSASTWSQTFQGYAVSHYTGWCNSGSLVGTLEAKELDTDGTVYLLQKQDEVVGWYKYTGDNIVQSTANRAYLYVPSTSAGIRKFIPLFDGSETTAITTVSTEGVMANDYYNLSGQRVSKPTKGLYIVGGKKIIVR